MNGDPLIWVVLPRGMETFAQEQPRARTGEELSLLVPRFCDTAFHCAPAGSLSEESPEGWGAHGHLSARILLLAWETCGNSC